MEAPPAPPPAALPPVAAATSTGMYSEPIDDSPRFRHANSTGNESLPGKLRLICSYGGHIVPRPHDKTLCYVGGETKLIVIDRHTSLSGLQNRLSKALLRSQSFTLKYQIPSEDLDSLISVATDEDLENMVDEYDRLNNAAGGHKSCRLRLFLFPRSPSNIEQLLVETGSGRSDDWFFNALNGKTSALSGGASDRGFSDSSSINNLLGLDEDLVGKDGNGGKDGENPAERPKIAGNIGVDHDVHSIPDSPMLENRSSYGSTSSSPSVANLPPIKVRVDEKLSILGIEDQFQQMNPAGGGHPTLALPVKPEDFGVPVAPASVTGPIASGLPAAPVFVADEYAANRVFSDDELSDHGGYIKIHQVKLQEQTQLPHQPIAQIQQKPTGFMDLPSPDTMSSEGSAKNPLPGQNQVLYQERISQLQSGNAGFTPNQSDFKNWEQNSVKFQVQPQLQPHQFVHAGSQYIPSGAMPVASYYHVYATQQEHHPQQPPLDQQYPFYFMPTRSTQPYNLQGQQSAYGEFSQSAPSSRPQAPPPASVFHHVAYNVPSSKTDLPKGLYETAAGTSQGPQLVHLPSGLHQTQFVGYGQVPRPSTNAAFTDPARAQIYYTQPLPP